MKDTVGTVARKQVNVCVKATRERKCKGIYLDNYTTHGIKLTAVHGELYSMLV